MFYTSTRKPGNRELKRKKRAEFKVSPVFVPQILVLNVGCHTISKDNSTQQMSQMRHRLTSTVLFVPVKLIAWMAKALKSTQGVLTTMLTTAIVHTAFIYI